MTEILGTWIQSLIDAEVAKFPEQSSHSHTSRGRSEFDWFLSWFTWLGVQKTPLQGGGGFAM